MNRYCFLYVLNVGFICLLNVFLINGQSSDIKGDIISIPVKPPDSEEINKLRDTKLIKYQFFRNKYNPEDVTLLLGNNEMGGRANLDGLGFERLWFSDFWLTNAARMPIYGPEFSIPGLNNDYTSYKQILSLKDAILTTEIIHPLISYKSEIFFSAANRKLLVIRISGLKGEAASKILLHLPVYDVDPSKGNRHNVVKSETDLLFRLEQRAKQLVTGTSDDAIMGTSKKMFPDGDHQHITNKMIYAVWCSVPMVPVAKTGDYSFDLNGREEIVLLFGKSTNWDGGILQYNAIDAISGNKDFALLKEAHSEVWKGDWEKTAVLDIPDRRHDQTWYRSLFWLFCTSGSDRFLPGECQFSDEGWNMIPFTYGAAGWAIQAFTMLGHQENASRMLEQCYKPGALNRNALKLMKDAQDERMESGMIQPPRFPQNSKSDEAMAFAHEIRNTGDCTLLNICNQGHLVGFGLELFIRNFHYYPSEKMLVKYLYPLAKGTAEYWSNALIWDHERKEYITAKTYGTSEGYKRNNNFEAVLTVKKCLRTAIEYARELKMDSQYIRKWDFIEKNLHYPTNGSSYVAYLGHDGKIPEKAASYTGIRFINAANFVNQELVGELNKENVTDLLSRIATSSNYGTGYAVFQSAQTATSEALFGRGDEALGYMEGMLRALDKTGTCFLETENEKETGGNKYFLTNSNGYILTPIFLLMQTINGEIKPFPAVPGGWKDIAFYNLPAENRIKVSGAMKNGKVLWVSYIRDGKEILRKSNKDLIVISQIIKKIPQ